MVPGNSQAVCQTWEGSSRSLFPNRLMFSAAEKLSRGATSWLSGRYPENLIRQLPGTLATRTHILPGKRHIAKEKIQGGAFLGLLLLQSEPKLHTQGLPGGTVSGQRSLQGPRSGSSDGFMPCNLRACPIDHNGVERGKTDRDGLVQVMVGGWGTEPHGVGSLHSAREEHIRDLGNSFKSLNCRGSSKQFSTIRTGKCSFCLSESQPFF